MVGAGMVGACCAYYLQTAGHEVTVLDRTGVAAGTTSGGEGNLLVSDKAPGPELDLALRSADLWTELGERLGGDSFELDAKGGVVVAPNPDALAALNAFADAQRTAGVDARSLGGAELFDLEPHLSRDLVGGMHYPADAQVQPMLAAAQLISAFGRAGGQFQPGVTAGGLRVERERISGVITDRGIIPAEQVVNAAGTWSGDFARLCHAPIPILPRRGLVLVTEPLPPVIRHKVYSADYVANVSSAAAGLETSSVIEGTRAGTVLIGASRERVGFDRSVSVPVVRRLATLAVRMFPMLAGVDLLRVYAGFRPYSPDHLPIIGEDPRRPGLFHACGHEGAGIGLAPATGELITDLIGGRPTAASAVAFRPDRFDRVEVPA